MKHTGILTTHLERPKTGALRTNGAANGVNDTSSNTPSGAELARINALQARRGKPALQASDVLVIPVRLTGNQLTDRFTRFPDAELEAYAEQINAGGGPMLFGHDDEELPEGTFFEATVTREGSSAWLDTTCYVMNDEDGQALVRDVNAGIVNEASIGFRYAQMLCSITGGSYWESPYMRGQTYPITDPQTGVIAQRQCFVWLIGCEFMEGSLVYRGAHPGTQVGGQFSSATGTIQASVPPLASPAAGYGPRHARLSIDFARDLEKPARAPAQPAPTLAPQHRPEHQRPEHQEEPMTQIALTVLATALGLNATSTEQQTLEGLARTSKFSRDVTALTGQDSLEKSLGVLAAWKTGAEQTDTLSKKLEKLEGERGAEKLSALLEQGKRDGKLSPAMIESWASKQTPEALEAFLAVAPRVIPGSAETKEPAPTATTSSPALTFNGKTWAQLAPIEKHNLFVDNKDLYDAMKNASN